MFHNNFFENEKEESNYINEVKIFISDVFHEKYKKENIKEKIESYYMKVTRITSRYRIELWRFNKLLDNFDNNDTSKINIIEIPLSGQNIVCRTKDELLDNKEKIETKLNVWKKLCEDLEKIRNENRNFNKSLCFSNIREMIRENPDVKIGQIESEAGIRLGYMSRLEKGDNAAEPSVEFIVTAAKLLNVSVDTLISVDFTSLTPTEKYLVNFIEKLKLDTLSDKLDWSLETQFDLSKYDDVFNGKNNHPLFSLETFYRQTETGYPDLVTENVYVSKSFGPNTYINGDCFNLRLKNGSIFYLMNLAKDVHQVDDKDAVVKEAVVYVPGGKTQVLATTKDEYPIGQMVDRLYLTIKERMKHPKLNNDIMTAIDAFMKNDLEDDKVELPF